MFSPKPPAVSQADRELLKRNETDAITLEKEELKRLLYLASPFANMALDEEPLFL